MTHKYAPPGSEEFRLWYSQQRRKERKASHAIPEPTPSLCDIPNFNLAGYLQNSDWSFDQETGQLTVTNDGGGTGGAFIVAFNDLVPVSSGVLAMQIKLISSDSLATNNGNIGIFFGQVGATIPLIGCQASFYTDDMLDSTGGGIADGGDDISPIVEGEYAVGIKLDMDTQAGSWKDTNGNTGSLVFNSAEYNPAVDIFMMISANIDGSGDTTIIEVNAGSEAWHPDLESFLGENTGYCAYTG